MTIPVLPALLRSSLTFRSDVDNYLENLLPTWAAAIAAGMREKLTAAMTIYVSVGGFDSVNSGGISTPYATMQAAIDRACSYDLGLYDLTIQCDAGTRTEGVTLRKYVTGGGVIIIKGDTTTPANCLMSCTSQSCFSADGQMEYRIEGFKLQTTTSGYGVLANSMAKINLGAMTYGACANDHIYALNGAVIGTIANYTITGGATSHLNASSGGIITDAGRTVTITGTPAFGTAYAKADKGSIMSLEGNTYSGSATGLKYIVNTNAVVSSGVTLPGGTAGTTATGGQYA
ncbi:MAG: hypothetical protein WC829_18930 [Hyphomicrobium sp.]|jgi:hypothetical protein